MRQEGESGPVESFANGVSDPVRQDRPTEGRAESPRNHRAEPGTDRAGGSLLGRAIKLFDPKTRSGNTKHLVVRIKTDGEIVVSESEPPKEVIAAIEARVLATVRERVLQALLPEAPTALRRKAPPPPSVGPVTQEDRERARKELRRVGMVVRDKEGAK